MSEYGWLLSHIRSAADIPLLMAYIRSVVLDSWPPEYAAAIDEIFQDDLVWRGPRRPEPGQTVAVSFENAKTAALVFDRVWALPAAASIPLEVGVYGATVYEVCSFIDYRLWRLNKELYAQAAPKLLDSPMGDLISGQGHPARHLAEVISVHLSRPATPIYATTSQRDLEYKPGDNEVVLTALANMPLPLEDGLTWQQVVDFRCDTESRANYRQFVHWLDKDMIGRSPSYIADELGTRLLRYEAALRKHGITTVIGAVESIIDPKFVAGTTALATGISLLADPLSAAIAAAGLAVGKGACTAARAFLDLRNARVEAPEVAFVYQLTSAVATPSDYRAG